MHKWGRPTIPWNWGACATQNWSLREAGQPNGEWLALLLPPSLAGSRQLMPRDYTPWKWVVASLATESLGNCLECSPREISHNACCSENSIPLQSLFLDLCVVKETACSQRNPLLLRGTYYRARWERPNSSACWVEKQVVPLLPGGNRLQRKTTQSFDLSACSIN